MLCQFTFQNFKSYKNETTLDYQAAVLPEFKDTLSAGAGWACRGAAVCACGTGPTAPAILANLPNLF